MGGGRGGAVDVGVVNTNVVDYNGIRSGTSANPIDTICRRGGGGCMGQRYKDCVIQECL